MASSLASTISISYKQIGGAIVLKTLKDLADKAIDTTIAFDKMNQTMGAASGNNAALAASNLRFVEDAAETMGLKLISSAEAFGKLTAATQGTVLAGKQTREIFTALAAANTKLGGSADSLRGIIKAFTDMISKGTVSMEELKGQLGDRLPGAMQIAAKSMGLTTEQLIKMVSNGELLAEELLPQLADALNSTYNDGKFETAQANINRLDNAWINFMNSLISSEALSQSVKTLTLMTNALNGQRVAVNETRGFWAELGVAIATATHNILVHNDIIDNSVTKTRILSNEIDTLEQELKDLNAQSNSFNPIDFFDITITGKIDETKALIASKKKERRELADAEGKRLKDLEESRLAANLINTEANNKLLSNISDRVEILRAGNNEDVEQYNASVINLKQHHKRTILAIVKMNDDIKNQAQGENRLLTSDEQSTVDNSGQGVIDANTALALSLEQLQIEFNTKRDAKARAANDKLIREANRASQEQLRIQNAFFQSKTNLAVANEATELGRLEARFNGTMAAINKLIAAETEGTAKYNTLINNRKVIDLKYAQDKKTILIKTENDIRSTNNNTESLQIRSIVDQQSRIQARFDFEKRLILENLALYNGSEAGKAAATANATAQINDKRRVAAEQQKSLEESNFNDFERFMNNRIDLQDEFANIGMQGIDQMAGAFADFATGSEQSFGEFFRSFMKQISAMIIKALILKAIEQALGALGSIGGGGTTGISSAGSVSKSTGDALKSAGAVRVAAKGAAFGFAKGGQFTNSVVTSPTNFAFGGGFSSLGKMGEAGPEAVMPLSRDASGSLGVKLNGGSGGNTTINNYSTTVHIKGGDNPKDDGQKAAEAFMKTVARQQIANEIRPGGLINTASKSFG